MNGSTIETRQVHWEKVFTNCFCKVDNEVGGKASRNIPKESTVSYSNTFEAVALETVGSTAVVAVLCSSHIVVANCGDSRAVLYRGKKAIALSNDHKVSLSSLFWLLLVPILVNKFIFLVLLLNLPAKQRG